MLTYKRTDKLGSFFNICFILGQLLSLSYIKKLKFHDTFSFFRMFSLSFFHSNFFSQTYAADIFFAQSWKDHRLRFPQNMTGEYRLLPVSWLKDIWRPDAFFKNAKSVTFQTMTIPNHYLWLNLDSTILYMVKWVDQLNYKEGGKILPIYGVRKL